MRVLLLSLILAQPQKVVEENKIYTANSSAVFADSHFKTLTPYLQQYALYLSSYNIPKQERSKYARVASFICNSLSTRKKIYIPEFVNGSDETVIYVNLLNYEWLRKDIDELAEIGSGVRPFPEPYFHSFLYEQKPVKVSEETVVTEIIVGSEITVISVADCYKPGVVNQVICQVDAGSKFKVLSVHDNLLLIETKAGRGWIYKTNVQINRKETFVLKPTKEKIFTSGIALDPVIMTNMISKSQAKAPIFRTDWFIANASMAPAYYKILRLGNKLKDFENLIYADPEYSKKARSEDKGLVVQSTISRNNRTLIRRPAQKGAYWSSHDTLKSVNDRKYITNFLDEEFDATEDIGNLPNGLQVYFITDGKGNRLDRADTNIVIDNTSISKVVECAKSCMVCHVRGINPIKDEIRTLTKTLSNVESVKLLNINEKDAYRVADLFGSNLDKQIIADQNYYADAVLEATGVQPEKISSELLEIYNNYIEKLLTKEQIALDFGISLKELEEVIRKSDDPVFLGLIKQPFRPVRRDQFEESFQGLMLTVIKHRGGIK